MYFQSLLLISFLGLSPILNIAIAHPLAVSAGITAGRLSNGQNGSRPGNPCRRRECAGTDSSTTEDTFHFSSGETSASIPDSWIFHGPDGDAKSNCQNRLPVNVLYAVEEGHGCKKMAEIYNDVNTSAGFNCKVPAQQRASLCGEAPHYGALAQSCYEFLLRSYPFAAPNLERYQGLCTRP